MRWTRPNRRRDFEEQALPHLDAMFRYSLSLLGDPSRAEDATQEACLRAWRSFDTFEPGTNLRAWLFRILMNCVHDHRRQWLSRPAADNSDEILANQTADDPTPAEITDEEMLGALQALPGPSREVLLLADVEGFAYKEIAILLGLRIGTVMSRLSRARGKLRQELRGTGLRQGARRAGEGA